MSEPADKKRKKIRLGDLLVQHKVISEQQLQQALTEQKNSGHKLGRVMVQLGLIGEDELMRFLADQLQLPIVDLRHYKFRSETVHLLPEQHARRYRAIVLAEKQNELTVGMADPTDLFAFDELRRLLKKPISVALVREPDLLRAIDTVYRRTDEITTLAEELGEELSESDFDIEELDSEGNEDDALVIKLLRSMFEDAAQIGASDIHIEPDESVVRIRQRVDGRLQEQIIEGRKVASALVTRLKLMAQLNISEKRLPQDGRFAIRVRKRRLDVRLSTMPIVYGESVVMRLLDQSTDQLDFDTLGIPDRILEPLKTAIQRTWGMLIVTGPTGSGKTTTLYACLNFINKPEFKIITVEDPVEYRLPRINQVQIKSKIGLDFSRVLRTALRQDPDVVMIGEMRDQETVEIGLRAAMTGHLVLSTLHTTNAVDSVVRLMDMGAPGYLVASSVTAVLAQRLIRRICDSCIEEVEPTTPQRVWLSQVLGDDAVEETRFKRGTGCTYCGNTGYRGRIGVYELLELDDELTELLKRGNGPEFSQAARQREHYKPLLASALRHLVEGITSIEEVLHLAGGVDAMTDAEDSGIPDDGVERLSRHDAQSSTGANPDDTRLDPSAETDDAHSDRATDPDSHAEAPAPNDRDTAPLEVEWDDSGTPAEPAADPPGNLEDRNEANRDEHEGLEYRIEHEDDAAASEATPEQPGKQKLDILRDDSEPSETDPVDPPDPTSPARSDHALDDSPDDSPDDNSQDTEDRGSSEPTDEQQSLMQFVSSTPRSGRKPDRSEGRERRGGKDDEQTGDDEDGS